MDMPNEIFDEDLINVINSLRISFHSFKTLDESNSVLKQKNKLLNEELQSIKTNETLLCKQDGILKVILDNLQKNSTLLEERNLNLQAELKVAIQLNRKYKNDIDKMEEKYINEIQTLNEDHAKEIKQLKNELQNKIETINFNSVLSKEEHTIKIDELKSHHSTKIMELKLEHIDSVEEYESAIKKLNDKIFEITTNYDKLKEKCDKLEKKLTSLREKNAQSCNPYDDDIFTDKPTRLRPGGIDNPKKSNIEPTFATKITKSNVGVNKTKEVVIEKPKKRKLFNPRSEIILFNDE